MNLRKKKKSKAPFLPRRARPPRWQNVALFAWMACTCHFRCVPPRFGSCPCVRPPHPASGLLACVRQSVHGPAQIRALVRHRLGEQRGCPRARLINQPSTVPLDPKSMSQHLYQRSPHLPSIQGNLLPWRKPKQANHQHLATQFFVRPAF